MASLLLRPSGVLLRRLALAPNVARCLWRSQTYATSSVLAGSSLSPIPGIGSVPKGLSLSQAYQHLQDSGHVHADASQAAVVEQLSRVHDELVERASDEAVKGLYIQGGVGCGKTFCMDLFYQYLDVERKARVHFHSFMLGIHRQLFKLQQLQGQDPLAAVAHEIAQEASVICFDEFQVTDVADAMILKRLLESLISHNVVFVMTSNRMPEKLYWNGLNRAQFLPAIDLIQANCQVFPFPKEAPDYRLMGEESQTWMNPLSAREKFDAFFVRLTKRKKIKSGTIEVQGRRVCVPAKAGGVAKFGFGDLCEEAKGAADYIAIASSYHTVLLDGIPSMDETRLPLVRRFITLIDVLYENHVKVIALAESPLEKTYVPSGHSSHRDEDFAWDRTVSRLTEMQSKEYLKGQWGGGCDFLRKFEVEALSEHDLRKVWEVYDVNGDGALQKEELSFLLSDVGEIKTGRREVVDQTELQQLYAELNIRSKGDGVMWDDFKEYFRENGGVTKVIESHFHFNAHCESIA